jgi:hypothetical protein
MRNVFGAKTGSNRIEKIANAEPHYLHACEDSVKVNTLKVI